MNIYEEKRDDIELLPVLPTGLTFEMMFCCSIDDDGLSFIDRSRKEVLLEEEEEEEEEEKDDDGDNCSKVKTTSWRCESCGNENFGWRLVCNMRNCRKLKPKRLLNFTPPKDSWVCFSCGNLNFNKKHRHYCNMRNCKAPRYPK